MPPEPVDLDSKLKRLFPNGSLPTREMAQRLIREGITNIGLSRLLLLTRESGRQNILIVHFGICGVGADGTISEDDDYREELDDYANLIGIRYWQAHQLGKLNLGNFRRQGIRAGKINPFDPLRLPVRSFLELHYIVSKQTADLASQGLDIIIPAGETRLECRPLQTLLEELRRVVTQPWNFKVMNYLDWERFDPRSRF